MVISLQQAVSFIKSGDKEKGKKVLLRLLEQQPDNDKAWVWLTAVVDTDEMRLECLEKALLINPQNQLAAKGAAKLREKLGLPEANDEELPFPELTAQRWDRPAVDTTETWSYEPYKPQPPPLPEPTRTPKATSKIQRTVLSTPFVTILFAPRYTVQTILRHHPKRHVMLLSALLGVVNSVIVIWVLSLFFPLLRSLPIATNIIAHIVIGAVYGILYFYVAGYVISMLGFILGGTGTPGEVRTALVWSHVPRIYLFPLQGLLIYLLLPDIVAENMARASTQNFYAILVLILAFFGIAMSLWFFYSYPECIGAAHGFSYWRAWTTILLPTFVILTLFFTLQAVACWPMLRINWELYPQCILLY